MQPTASLLALSAAPHFPQHHGIFDADTADSGKPAHRPDPSFPLPKPAAELSRQLQAATAARGRRSPDQVARRTREWWHTPRSQGATFVRLPSRQDRPEAALACFQTPACCEQNLAQSYTKIGRRSQTHGIRACPSPHIQRISKIRNRVQPAIAPLTRTARQSTKPDQPSLAASRPKQPILPALAACSQVTTPHTR